MRASRRHACLVAFLATLAGAATAQGANRDLYLEVFINGVSTEMIAAFHEEADGRLSGVGAELENVGVKVPLKGRSSRDRVRLSDLPGAGHRYEEATQTIHFELPESARAPRRIDLAAPERGFDRTPASLGALVNYSLLAGAGGKSISDVTAFDGVSGYFEPRVFGPFGVLSGGLVVETNDGPYRGTRRLDTTWAFSQPEAIRTWRAGDVATGALPWTRSVRLGGLQVQRDFALRPDLVTFPLPALGGSAAVPSTIEVYVDNARRYLQDVPAGPFQVTNLPVVTGAGQASLVVRDPQGREVVTQAAYFASSSLLRRGLGDYSLEMGFARRNFGLEAFDYDERPMGSATGRYGLSDTVTIEAHAEGGKDLINAGAGLAIGLGRLGIGSLSAATSHGPSGDGYLGSASLEVEIGSLRIGGRLQRTFGDYDDIASITADRLQGFDGFARPHGHLDLVRPARAIDQLSLTIPVPFDDTFFNATYTRLETAGGDNTALIGLSHSRPVLGRARLHTSGFASLSDDAFGLFVGLSYALGEKLSATTSVSSTDNGASAAFELVRPEGLAVGDYGWRMRDSEGSLTNRSVAGSYRTSVARFSGSLAQYDDFHAATLEAEGSLIAAEGGIFASNRIDDAFAIVNAEVPGVTVLHENHAVARTGRNGKAILPNLRANEANTISIDPSALPIEANVQRTSTSVVPVQRSSVSVDFGIVARPNAALVGFVDHEGAALPAGSLVRIDETGTEALIGYGGEAYVSDLLASNTAMVTTPQGNFCQAVFSYRPNTGAQVSIRNVRCQNPRTGDLQ